MTTSASSARTTAVARVALALLCAYLLASALSFWPYTVDDAFISLRYAQNLAWHGELVWNAGERVEGFSNPLWTLYGALGIRLGLAPVLWVKIGGLVCAVVAVPATYALARRIGGSTFVAVTAAALVATNASVALWSVAGLETTSFMALLVLFAWRFEAELAARADGSRTLPLAAALFVLVWISRPEAPAYGLYVLVRRCFVPGRPPFGREDVVSALVAGLPILGYELFGLLYYGGLLPATHGAKVGGSLPLFDALAGGRFGRFLGVRFLLGQGAGFAAMWIAGIAGALLAIRRLPPAAWATSLAGLVFVAYAFTDWMPRYRFLVPPLPFLALLCAIGLDRLALLAGERRAMLGRALAAALVLAGAWNQATSGYDRPLNVDVAVEPRGAWPLRVVERVGTPWRAGRQELDAWFVLHQSPEPEWVVCGDIGFIGAFARNPLWDLRGLVTPTAAAFLPVAEDDPAFEETRRAMLDDMFAKNPALILLPVRARGMAPVPRRFRDALEQDPRTAERYVLRDDLLRARLIWIREDLVAPDVAERTAEALARLPSYDTALKRELAGRASAGSAPARSGR